MNFLWGQLLSKVSVTCRRMQPITIIIYISDLNLDPDTNWFLCCFHSIKINCMMVNKHIWCINIGGYNYSEMMVVIQVFVA